MELGGRVQVPPWDGRELVAPLTTTVRRVSCQVPKCPGRRGHFQGPWRCRVPTPPSSSSPRRHLGWEGFPWDVAEEPGFVPRLRPWALGVTSDSADRYETTFIHVLTRRGTRIHNTVK